MDVIKRSRAGDKWLRYIHYSKYESGNIMTHSFVAESK